MAFYAMVNRCKVSYIDSKQQMQSVSSITTSAHSVKYSKECAAAGMFIRSGVKMSACASYIVPFFFLLVQSVRV